MSNKDDAIELNELMANNAPIEHLEDIPDAPVATAVGGVSSSPATIDATAAQMWAVARDDYFPCESTVKTLEPGQYLVKRCEARGYYFSNKKVNLDDLISLPDNNSDQVLRSIADFWTKEAAFRELGFLWKRGILLWGPPGSGKTSTVQQLAKQIVDMGGISIYCTYPSHDAEGLRILRTIEPNRPIVVIMEDIDAIINCHGEADLLSMLDGELQIDNVVFVATTNYPERLDNRIVNRPSRFDERIKIGMPNAECRSVYLAAKCPRIAETDELAYWVEHTDGYSIAHLKELIVSVECLGNDRDTVLERLTTMITTSVSSSDLNRRVGF